MSCNDPRESDEARALAALERMSDEAVRRMADMMEEVAKKNPRPPRHGLKIQKPTKEK